MAQQTIGVGAAADDGTGDTIRAAFTKTNANFTDLYAQAGVKAAKGANSDITSLSGLTTPLSITQGGTGATTSAGIRAAAGIQRPYRSGGYYYPEGTQATVVGTNGGSGSMRCYPGIIREPITITELGLKIGTASSGGNIQIAIYASDPTSQYPTGAPIVSTDSLSTTTAGSVSATGLAVTLPAGLYWWCTNTDNTTVATYSILASSTFFGAVIGVNSSIAGLIGGPGNPIGLSKTQAFNSWPTLTGNITTDALSNIYSATVSVIGFKVQ